MVKRKILIIDDEQDICLLLSGLLRSIGYKTHHALSLNEAYSKIHVEKPEIIFLDLNLPDGSGFSAIPYLKDTLPGIKIILISAYDGEKEKNRAFQAGVSDFLGKPFDREEILSALHRLEQ